MIALRCELQTVGGARLCDAEAETALTGVCVHEHVRSANLCRAHADEHIMRQQFCVACLRDSPGRTHLCAFRVAEVASHPPYSAPHPDFDPGSGVGQ